MEKFMLIIREDLNKLKKMSHEERKAGALLMMKWVEQLTKSGNYIMGDALKIEGQYVRKTDVTSDGPFIESKEGVSGVTLFNAENMEQAVTFAKSCPLVLNGQAAIEVRPLLAFDF
ncbi:MAG TPA: YciI family protein [Cyclobacteriaceae bacterium]|jgi:hypothetical protein|nr:YciI family protein [Cyclobacteriaceae bacterium]